MPERETKVALAEIARALHPQYAHILRRRRRFAHGRGTSHARQLGRGGTAPRRFTVQQRRQIAPSAPQADDLALIEFAEGGDDALPWPARGAHRLT